MKTILITGADGFIGKNLKELFKRSHEYTILSPGMEELDLTSSIEVNKYFDENPIDFIVHAATVEMSGKSYVSNVCELNLRMFFNLERARNSRCILFSMCSGSVYSRDNWYANMPESYFDVHVPSDGHSYSKYVIEKYINKSSRIVNLRIFGIFGKYENPYYKFISNSIAKNVMKMEIVINKNAIYDYIYIDDFYKIILKFLNNNISEGSFNITPSESIELVNICEIINEISDFKSKIKVLESGFGKEYTGSNSALLNAINGYEFMSYKDSINDLYCNLKNKSFDLSVLMKDDFLTYAKKIN